MLLAKNKNVVQVCLNLKKNPSSLVLEMQKDTKKYTVLGIRVT